MIKIKYSNNIYSFFIFFILCFIFLFCNPNNLSNKKLKASNGVIEISSPEIFTDLNKNSGFFKLDGMWEFYPNEFLMPGFVDINVKKPIFLSVPGVWNDVFNGGYGYGTFRLILILPEGFSDPIVFKIPEQGTAYSMYANGKLIASNGKIGTSLETSIPEYRPLISSQLLPEKRLEIIFHISNFHHRQGGLWYSVLVGKEEVIREIREKKLLIDFFLLGSILIMGIYHITLFTLRRKDKSSLLFALFCFIVILRLLSFNEKYLNHIFPDIPFSTMSKIEYLSYYLAVPLLSHFLYEIFPNEFKRVILFFIWKIAIFFSFLVLFTNIRIYSWAVTPFNAFTFICLFYIIYVIFLAIIHRRDGGKTILIGMSILILGTANDILFSMEIVHTEYIIPQCLLGFIFFKSILLSLRFSKAFRQVENLTQSLVELNNELEDKINKRTSELNSALKLIKGDLIVSQTIQSKIIPENINSINGLKLFTYYIPMIEVGGDFYDIHSLGEGITRIFIADATGHGVQGALITMLIKGEYRLLGPTISQPDELLKKLNEVFSHNYANINIFFTCFIIDIDIKKGELRYASAGHPEQVLVSGSEIRLLKGKGKMIGLIQESNYQLCYTSYQKNDKLFLFTDGLIEEFNSLQETFSEERLYGLIQNNLHSPVKTVMDLILNELKEFMKQTPMTDDITFIGIDYTEDI